MGFVSVPRTVGAIVFVVKPSLRTCVTMKEIGFKQKKIGRFLSVTEK